ncbi:MAG TPA: hypothetical protein PLB81_09580 [Deltaproteobacteria bacterium]|nr:hypothetical protein [Deltaproteobacteria bacterium]
MRDTFVNNNAPDNFSTFELKEPLKLNPDAFIGVMTNGANDMNAIYAADEKDRMRQ